MNSRKIPIDVFMGIAAYAASPDEVVSAMGHDYQRSVALDQYRKLRLVCSDWNRFITTRWPLIIRDQSSAEQSSSIAQIISLGLMSTRIKIVKSVLTDPSGVVRQTDYMKIKISSVEINLDNWAASNFKPLKDHVLDLQNGQTIAKTTCMHVQGAIQVKYFWTRIPKSQANPRYRQDVHRGKINPKSKLKKPKTPA